MTGDERFLAQIERRIEAAGASFGQAERAAVSTAQRAAVLEARGGFERWVEALHAHIATYEAGDRQEAIQASPGSGRALRKDHEASLAAADALAASAVRAGSASVAAASSRSVLVLVACLVVTLVAGVLLAAWLVRTVLRPVYMVLGMLGEIASQPSRDRLG